jgi:creatinine amidohydrolase
MLALAPDTVHMERAAANFPPPFPITLLSPDGRPACAWTARDFGPSGVIGDPTRATREQGLEILDTLAASWVQVLTELHALSWVVREEATWGRGAERGFIQSAA